MVPQPDPYYGSEEDELAASRPDRLSKKPLTKVSASESSPSKSHHTATDLGPEPHSSRSRRTRGPVTYNLKTLSYQTSSPSKTPNGSSKTLPIQIDLTGDLKATPNRRAQQTSDKSPSAKRRRISHSSSSQTDLDQGHPWNMVPSPEQPKPELLAYIWPILKDGGVEDPDKLLKLEYFRPLLCLPRKRDLVFNPDIGGLQWYFRTNNDIVALLVQLTGLVQLTADSSPKCCRSCDAEEGGRPLFQGCVVLASSNPPTQSFIRCANCYYRKERGTCCIKDRKLSMYKNQINSIADGHTATTAQPAGSSPRPSSSHSTTTSTASTPVAPRETEHKALPETPRQPSSEILSMEPWEKAPGRIRSRATAEPPRSEYLPPPFEKSYARGPTTRGALRNVCLHHRCTQSA